nr:ribonuclease H-like domain-containing protein [Tanacetum cinerariifolium]
MTDYSVWEVILNGDSPAPTRVIDGVLQPVAPTTAKQRLARKNELKARGTLLMALPDKHQLKFNTDKDAKSLMEAIEKRNKTDLEEQSLDDLFNSLKIYEAKVKSSSSIDVDDLEEIDLKWKGHFARECRSPKDTRRNSVAEPQRRNVLVETSTSNALVSQCDSVGNYDWSFQAEEEPTNYALIALSSSSSSSDNKALSTYHRGLVSDSEDESETKTSQNVPSFVQPTKQHVVPTAVVPKSKLVPINAARPITAVVPKIKVTRPRQDNHIVTKSNSPPRRHINHGPSLKANNSPPRVTAVKAPMVNTTNVVQGKWEWKPKCPVLDHVSRNTSASMTLKRFDYNDALGRSKSGVIDSGCSRHMIGNMSCLSDFEELNGGYVAFISNPKGGKISRKGKIKTGKLDFDDVYFVTELKFNLFNVSPMCDKKKSVLFTDTKFLVLSPDFKLLDENQVLLRATLDESNLWHRRLGHINFKTMNKLVKGNLVRGLPSKVFENDNTCVACKKGKQHRASCVQEHFDAEKAREEDVDFDEKEPEFEGKNPESEVNVSPSSSTQKHDNKTKREAKGMSHIESLTCYRNLSAEFEDFFDNSINEDNDADTSQLLDDPNMPELKDITYSDDEDDVGVEVDFNNLETSITVSPIPITRVHKDHPVTQIIGDLSSATQTRSMTRVTRDQVDLPHGKRAIGTKWVFRNKKDERGIVVRNKDRLVAQGHTQKEGIGYKEVFALVARIEAIRLFLAYASFMGFMVYQMDVKSAFMYGTIEEEVYVCQPLGFKDPDYPDKVYKVVKAHYDGKSASTPIDTEKPLLKDPNDQTVSGKDSSNPIMADNLPKIVWYPTHHVALMKSWLVQKQTTLGQKRTGKEILNPFMAGVNTPICDEDRLELMELMVFLLPSDEKVGIELIMTLTFADTYNMIAYLTKSDASEEFIQIIDFFNGSSIKYALTVKPNIYVSCIKQFWNSITVKKVNDIMRLQALVDKKKLIITEASIRDALRLDDAEGVECLPNEEIFAELARMGYEKPFTKLTFYKTFFSSQVGKGFSRVETPLFKGMIVEQMVDEGDDEVHDEGVPAASVVAEGVVSTADEVPTAVEEPSFPSPTPPTQPPQPSQDQPLTSQEEESEPAELQEVVDVVTTAKIITEVVTAASDTFTAASTTITAADVLIHAAIIVVAPTLTAAPSRRRKGVVIRDHEETATPSIIIHSEAKSKDKGKGILRKEKEDNAVKRYQALKRKPQTEAQARKNMMIYLKNVVGFKMDYFKGMTYDDIRLIFEKHFNSNVAFLQKTKEQIDEEDSIALKRLNESKEDKAAKRQKLDEEVKELRKHLMIVPNEDDDFYTKATHLARKVPIVNYEIYTENNKPYYKIKRADARYTSLNLEKSKKCLWSSEGQELETVRVLWCADYHIYYNTVDFASRDEISAYKNKVMNEFCEEKGIKRKYSVARTLQQNGVAERRNRTLIEEARTMLLDSKLPITFWAKAVNIACYVQNRVLVVKPHFKTSYELFRDHLGNFDGKSEEGFFVGYSTNSKDFRVYNTRTRKVQTLMILQEKEQVLMQVDLAWRHDLAKNISECHCGIKWVFRNKKDERGIVIRNKAILVSQGCTQEEGIDYDKVFAPVARIEAIRLFLAYASFTGLLIYQMDVKSAFWLQVKQKSDGIFISQDKYVDEILRKFKYKDVKTASTPMDKEKALLKDLDGDDVDVHLYRDSPFDLVAYTDSDYARASLDRKSTSGGFCDKYNMVDFLKKPQGSKDFHQIVDFLNASDIRYALTEYPTMYVSFINQFWCTASAKTLDNREIELNATVDGQVKTMSEAFVWRHLKLADADGINTLPTTKFFEHLALMGYVIDSDKLTFQKGMHDGLGRATTTTSSLEVEQGSGNISKTQTQATPSGLSSLRTSSKGGPGCHVTMGDSHVQSRPKRLSNLPNEPPLGEGNTSQSGKGSMQLLELMDICKKLSDEVTTLKNELTSTKAVYIMTLITLTKRVKKLEKKPKNKRRRAVINSSEDEEAIQSSKQGEVHETGEHIMDLSTSSQTDDDETLAETLLNIKRSAAKDKDSKAGEGSSKEGESLKRPDDEELGQEQEDKEEIV